MTEAIITVERIQKAMHLIRGQKVLMDRDLAHSDRMGWRHAPMIFTDRVELNSGWLNSCEKYV